MAVKRRRWIRLIGDRGSVCVCIPGAGAGALPVHDSSSTGSRTVRPLRPGWPLAMDRPRAMLPVFYTLTPPAPLEKTDQEGNERREEVNSFLISTRVLAWACCPSFLAWTNAQHHTWTPRLFHASQNTHTHTHICMHHTRANPSQTLLWHTWQPLLSH